MQLAITERGQRLIALQERWDGLRQAKAAIANGDYEAAMRTGVVCRRVRWIGGKDGREAVEYEINTALIESLNSVKKRAAIETGQESENVNLTGQISAKFHCVVQGDDHRGVGSARGEDAGGNGSGA